MTHSRLRALFAPDAGLRHVLALDGGGVRGLLTLHALAAFEHALGRPACEAFDFFAGTSTGGIIAALLAFKQMKAKKILKLYDQMIGEVFVPSLRSSFLGRLFTRRMYDRAPALARLEDLLGDATLGDLRAARPDNPPALMLTTHDTVRNEEIFLSSYPFRTGKTNLYAGWKARDAVAATALSAPWYFGPWNGRFIDGGATVFNTPALQAAIEALDYCGEPLFARGSTHVWSFGTGTFAPGVRPGQPSRWWPLQWAARLYSDIEGDAEAAQLFGCRRMAVEREIVFHRFQLAITHDTLADMGIPEDDVPRLPIALDRADAVPFLHEVGKRWAEMIEWG